MRPAAPILTPGVSTQDWRPATRGSDVADGLLSWNVLFAGLALIGFVNGIAHRAISALRDDPGQAFLLTFDVSAIIWVALIVVILFLLRPPYHGVTKRDGIAASLAIAIFLAPAPQLSWLAVGVGSIFRHKLSNGLLSPPCRPDIACRHGADVLEPRHLLSDERCDPPLRRSAGKLGPGNRPYRKFDRFRRWLGVFLDCASLFVDRQCFACIAVLGSHYADLGYRPHRASSLLLSGCCFRHRHQCRAAIPHRYFPGALRSDSRPLRQPDYRLDHCRRDFCDLSLRRNVRRKACDPYFLARHPCADPRAYAGLQDRACSAARRRRETWRTRAARGLPRTPRICCWPAAAGCRTVDDFRTKTRLQPSDRGSLALWLAPGCSRATCSPERAIVLCLSRIDRPPASRCGRPSPITIGIG